jgi:4-carboxymuconolactone decarboxylase
VTAAGEERRKRGEETWKQVTMQPLTVPADPFQEAMYDFVSAEVWSRPGLTRKERRWISLSCAGASGQPVPVRAHVRAALESGDITADELREFTLHFAVYAGWPLASQLSMAIAEIAPEVEASQAAEGA